MKRYRLLSVIALTTMLTQVNNINAQAKWRLGGNSLCPGGDCLDGTNNSLGTDATANLPLNIMTNGIQRALFQQGGAANNAGRMALGNNLPIGFNPTSRLHLHQNGQNRIGFTNNGTGTAGNDGFQVGINNAGEALINQRENQPMRFYTANIQRIHINPNTAGAPGFVGIGTGFNAPLSRLHLNEPNNIGIYTQWTNTFTGATANSGLKIGVDALGTAQLIQQTNAPIIFYSQGSTLPNFPRERMRITYGNGGPVGNPPFSFPNVTRVGISYGDNLPPGNEIINPQAMLQGLPTNLAGGWRNWMDVGMFLGSAPIITEDYMYVGLKQELWGNDAVISWGDGVCLANQNPNNTHYFRFVYTTPAACNDAGSSSNGNEIQRITPDGFTGIGGDPVAGNNYSAALGAEPGNTLEVNSPQTTLGPTFSGLRFTDVRNTVTPITNPSNGVLSLSAAGDVIWVDGSSIGAASAFNGTSIDVGTGNVQLGQDIAAAGNPAQLINDREIPMNNFNLFLTDPVGPLTFGQNRMQIGTFGAAFPLDVKLTSSNNLPSLPALRVVGVTGATTDNLPIVSPLSSHPLYINNIANSMRIGVLAIGTETPMSLSPAQFSIGISAFGGGTSTTQGAYGMLSKSLSINAAGNSYGVYSTASGQGNLTGVFGCAGVGSTSSGTNIGVRGCASGGGNNFAGWFDGDVWVNGGANSGTGYLITSDQQFKTNVNVITNANTIINQLQPKTFFYDTVSYSQINFSGTKQYGLIAQEVETILPELVSNKVFPAQYDSLGNQISPDVPYKALNYNAFIAILMKGAQEQQIVIDSLLNAVQTLTTCVNNANLCSTQARIINNEDEGTTIELSNLNAIILDQNLPNPFAEKTSIAYNIPDDVMDAQLLFYDMSGRIIKQVEITDRGDSKLTVYGNNLEKGIYTYSLIADGKLIATKKMVKQ